MAERAKPSVRSPEEETFRRFYSDLLREISRPVLLAKLLFDYDIISSETKESVTSNADMKKKRALLDAVQHALANAPDPGKMFQSLLIALGKTGFGAYMYSMRRFITGECANSLEVSA